MQCTADPCWIFTLFRLIRMLSIELYTCMQPSSVPSHMVGSPSKSTGSMGYILSGTRSWLTSLSSSSSLDELHNINRQIILTKYRLLVMSWNAFGCILGTCLVWCRVPSGRRLQPIYWSLYCYSGLLYWHCYLDWTKRKINKGIFLNIF